MQFSADGLGEEATAGWLDNDEEFVKEPSAVKKLFRKIRKYMEEEAAAVARAEADEVAKSAAEVVPSKAKGLGLGAAKVVAKNRASGSGEKSSAR